MLMLPLTRERVYSPPVLFFSGLAGNAVFGGFGARPLLFTRIDEGSNPVPLPLPINNFPSATATADGYCPVGIKPRTFDFAPCGDFDFVVPSPRAFSESATTATALLCAFATYKVSSPLFSAI